MNGGAIVELVWIEKQIEHWIRFGRIVRTTIQSRSGSTVAFDPGAVFAFVRWQANDFGTTESRIDILRMHIELGLMDTGADRPDLDLSLHRLIRQLSARFRREASLVPIYAGWLDRSANQAAAAH